MNTSAILDEQILDGKTPVLQLTPNFIARSIQKTKDFGKIGHIPRKPKMVDEALESYKYLTKTYTTRETLSSN